MQMRAREKEKNHAHVGMMQHNHTCKHSQFHECENIYHHYEYGSMYTPVPYTPIYAYFYVTLDNLGWLAHSNIKL